MTYQMKQDIKYMVLITIALSICVALSGCATLRDYSEWKNKRDAGCGYCCPPAFGDVFNGGNK